jgi:hypothetical protein
MTYIILSAYSIKATARKMAGIRIATAGSGIPTLGIPVGGGVLLTYG